MTARAEQKERLQLPAGKVTPMRAKCQVQLHPSANGRGTALPKKTNHSKQVDIIRPHLAAEENYPQVQRQKHKGLKYQKEWAEPKETAPASIILQDADSRAVQEPSGLANEDTVQSHKPKAEQGVCSVSEVSEQRQGLRWTRQGRARR